METLGRGGDENAENFHFDITTETDPDKELVRVKGKTGGAVDVERRVAGQIKEVIDLAEGTIGTPLERIHQLEKQRAVLNFFEGVGKATEIKVLELNALTQARKILSSAKTSRTPNQRFSPEEYKRSVERELSSLESDLKHLKNLDEPLFPVSYDTSQSIERELKAREETKVTLADSILKSYRMLVSLGESYDSVYADNKDGKS